MMEHDDPRRWWALIAMVPATLAVGLDVTILSVALPSLAGSLSASTGQLQWFVVAYSLVFAAAMLPGGMLGDRYGRKKTLLIALVVFGIGSVASAYSGSANALIASRMVLGLGAAVVVPMVLALLPTMFSAEERPRALAVIMSSTMIGYPVGPLLGGWILNNLWWGWVFLINVPIVLIGLVTVAMFVPESRDASAPKVDLAGVVLSSAGISALVYAVVQAGEQGWTDGAALGFGAVGIALLAAFVVVELNVTDPLIDLGLFRDRLFAWGTTLSVVVSFAMFGLLFAAPLYFGSVLGADAQGTGTRLLPLILGLLVGAGLADQLPPRTGVAAGLAGGFAVLAVGLGLGALTDAGNGTAYASLWVAISGLGLGLTLTLSIDAALGSLSEQRAGVGSALIQALRMIGGSFGAALLGSILASGYRGQLDVSTLDAASAAAARESVTSGVQVAQDLGSASLHDSVIGAFLHGMSSMLWCCAAISVLAIVPALRYMPGRTRQATTVEQVAAGTPAA